MPLAFSQVWKNETLAEQNKLPPTAKPVLLSKDIEMKIAGLDREVQYLLNKAKFSKPRKRENATRAEASRNATGSPENGKAAPPRQETRKGEQTFWQVLSASGCLGRKPEQSSEAPGVPFTILHVGGGNEGGRAAFSAKWSLHNSCFFCQEQINWRMPAQPKSPPRRRKRRWIMSWTQTEVRKPC